MRLGQSIALVSGACGWDLSRESREISRARGLTIFENLTDVPSDTFDLVFSRHTLEHVPDPLRYLEDARRFAGQDGRLRLVLPGRERATVTTDVDAVNLHLYCWTLPDDRESAPRRGVACRARGVHAVWRVYEDAAAIQSVW